MYSSTIMAVIFLASSVVATPIVGRRDKYEVRSGGDKLLPPQAGDAPPSRREEVLQDRILSRPPEIYALDGGNGSRREPSESLEEL
ncbi:hypothetical protein BC827DRAFT_1242075, partial [Russula dissimulans]